MPYQVTVVQHDDCWIIGFTYGLTVRALPTRRPLMRSLWPWKPGNCPTIHQGDSSACLHYQQDEGLHQFTPHDVIRAFLHVYGTVEDYLDMVNHGAQIDCIHATQVAFYLARSGELKRCVHCRRRFKHRNPNMGKGFCRHCLARGLVSS